MMRRFWLTRTSVILALVLMSNLVIAGPSPMVVQLTAICANIKAVVPIVALLMFILAGGIYAIGQVLGAETRARASVWATAMLVGGVIGLIIAASAQYLVEIFAQFAIGGTSIISGSGITC